LRILGRLFTQCRVVPGSTVSSRSRPIASQAMAAHGGDLVANGSPQRGVTCTHSPTHPRERNNRLPGLRKRAFPAELPGLWRPGTSPGPRPRHPTRPSQRPCPPSPQRPRDPPGRGPGESLEAPTPGLMAARSPPGLPPLPQVRRRASPAKVGPSLGRRIVIERGPRTGLGTGLRPTIRERHHSHTRSEVLMRVYESRTGVPVPTSRREEDRPGLTPGSRRMAEKTLRRQKNWSAKPITKPFVKRQKFDIGSRIE